MKRVTAIAVCSLAALSVAAGQGQSKRLWVLRSPGEITEYDPDTFVIRETVKVPPEVMTAPQNLSINHAGQMLFASSISLPLDESDVEGKQKFWLWNGHAGSTLSREVTRSSGATGSNLAIAESAPVPYLSADGLRLYWFSNQAHRLQRDGVDLSTKTTWLAWQTDLTANQRHDLAALALPDCSCPTGSCEESCAYGSVWVPNEGVGNFFLLTQFVAGKDQPAYKASSVYEETNKDKWKAAAIDPALRRVLDAPNADTILEAVPDTGCCGWSNQSDDQALLRLGGKMLTVFDERSEYKNPDYDVSFYAENGRVSPDLSAVAMTIVASTEANKAIQLAAEGQADPDESQRIRKALLDIPAVEITGIDRKGLSEPRRIAFLPRASLVGWLSENEILIVEDGVLVIYNVASKARRKSNVHAESAQSVFLR